MTKTSQSAWRPHLIDPDTGSAIDLASGDIRATLAAITGDPQTTVLDTLAEQIDDLLQSRYPSMSSTDRAPLRSQLETQLSRWVYYPWLRALFRTLPPAELREARLARNRNKITAGEQARLAEGTIAIVGLSVGNHIARTLVMEGVGGRFRLADSDTLALSNLNRLSASITDLGLSKAVLAARALFEIDPYLDIEIFPAGVDPDALDDFLLAGGCEPDLVIEECDDFAVKIGLRDRLRALGIPVLMESSVRGTLDVERFDLEPERPLLHGLLEGIAADAGPDIDNVKALVAHVLPHMSTRTRQSIGQVGITLRSWPQLASEIALGAATATAAARKILLGIPLASGRYVADIDQWLSGRHVAPGLRNRQFAPMAMTEAGWVE
ncbi:MAG: ThiF family adenylyltransferase [Proteobacteria bacterium]|nr:ThiF family adenylyltransferase [Pseudomonadota bacterium]